MCLSIIPEVKRELVEVCPNCIALPEVNPVTQKKEVSDLRIKYNIPKDAKIFIYGGNLGKPQGIKFLVDCLDKEKDNKKYSLLLLVRERSLVGSKILLKNPKRETLFF